MITLRWSDEVLPAARAVLAAERDLLRDAGVPGDLGLVGGSSVPGALTRGDVDLHLRVPPGELAAAVAVLRRLHDVVHPEIWAPTLATFTVRAAPPAGLAVTPRGSEHDLRFTRTWALLAADPALLAEHNATKRAAVALGEDGYERAKSAFVDRVVAAWDTHPSGGAAGVDPSDRRRAASRTGPP